MLQISYPHYLFQEVIILNAKIKIKVHSKF
jgi:hypothetical protein